MYRLPLEYASENKMQSSYAIVIERAENNWSACAPDLPGCITTGQTREECEANMVTAIHGHLATMKDFGFDVPQLSSEVY